MFDVAPPNTLRSPNSVTDGSVLVFFAGIAAIPSSVVCFVCLRVAVLPTLAPQNAAGVQHKPSFPHRVPPRIPQGSPGRPGFPPGWVALVATWAQRLRKVTSAANGRRKEGRKEGRTEGRTEGRPPRTGSPRAPQGPKGSPLGFPRVPPKEGGRDEGADGRKEEGRKEE